MSKGETASDGGTCSIRILVDPPSNHPSEDVPNSGNHSSMATLSSGTVQDAHQEAGIQLETLEIPNHRRRSTIVPTNLATVPYGVEMTSEAFGISEVGNESKDSGDQQETIEFPNHRRRSTILPPTLATVPSGVEMDNEAFTLADEPSISAIPPSRRASLIDTNSQNSFRLGRIQSSLRRFGMNLSRRGSTSTNTETVPRIANYINFFNVRSNSRPTLEELHEPVSRRQNVASVDPNKEIPMPVGDKFGWIEGVLIRNTLSIWGIMLFLRISWVVALSGIWQTLIIIAISTFITLMTALSMSAIATNGEIGGGGTYYVMSRVLGPEFGGSIGVIFAIANAINASLNVVGFCQSVQDVMRNYGGGAIIVDGADNDIRIIGSITMIAVCALCGLGAKYEAKTQGVMLVILLVALSNFLVGSIMGPGSSEQKQAKGFLGYDLDLIRENWSPGYTFTDGQMQDFFSVFSVYFPAGIGILSGANVSGDLKDPNSAIPKGTILAICITSLSYAVVAIICGATMKRAATGSVDDFRNGTHLDCISKNCTTYGIYYDYQAMTLISGFGPLNYAGCFAASLSSALASYVSCPKLLQVIADDKLYPYWLVGVLGKGYGKSNEPIRAYAFTFVLALVFVLIAHLDVIALLISNFFLATFALMNYSTFHVSLVKPIGWRPTFKYYNMWLSLLTAALCVVGMFLISWPVALITIAIVLFFYLVVHYRNPEVNWGSSSQAQTYSEALSSIQQLVHVEDHVKNYRPQILALTGHPASRPALVDFAYLICKKNSLLICANIMKGHQSSNDRSQISKKAYQYLWDHSVNGFFSLVNDVNLQQGTSALLQAAGVGKMKPNILLLGFKNDWQVCEHHSLDHYFAAIHTGFDLHVAVAILRTPEGLDYTAMLTDLEDGDFILHTLGNLHRSSSSASTISMDSASGTETTVGNQDEESVQVEVESKRTRKRSKLDSPILTDRRGKELPKHIVTCISTFRRKQRRGLIDVWWLYDDGGLTLLLPHIIHTRSNWSSCKLRVFCVATGQEDLENERKGMAALLAKFRITYSDLTVIKDIKQPPKEPTKTWFDGLIRDFAGRDQLPVTELIAMRAKTDRHLRLRELLIEHSSQSNLVVMTLPMPRKGTIGAPLYMAWLETLSANMPPFLLIRGNQSSVLTFYS